MPVYRTVSRAGAAGLLLAPLLASCSQDKPLPPRAGVVISPAGVAVKPDTPIVVRADEGTLQDVTVRDQKGTAVEGVMADDGSTWTSRFPLVPGSRYRVRAAALGTDGQIQTGGGSFTTTRPKQTVESTVLFPSPREVVGVGMAVKIGFDRAVTNKEGVERALEVRSSKPVEGAWRWFDDQNVIFRPKEYWPAYTRVRVVGHLTGVPLAGKHYGARDVDLEFNVGERIESIGDARKHRVVVKRNGRTVRTMPASMGKGGVRKYTTTNGIHLTMEKEYMTVMTSPGIGPGQPGYYRQNVNWTVRISNSGEYLHSAPWSVGSQGRANVSHGCINLSPANGKWFHNISHRGDPVVITGTDRELEPENGWGYWQLGWKEWLKGSRAQGFTTGPLKDSTATAGTRAPVGSSDVTESRQELRSP
ncbi:Ig-like domain-containing protein [Actinocorallia sp. B10E7]|uniref:L,D-transpeptidase n=1 Tax=Actinocorallia sp. B10E7 TaxID=3153558 RepID=UPI00325F0C94